jgi:hypothetical protein
MRLLVAAASLLIGATAATVQAADTESMDFSSVVDALARLRTDPDAQFHSEDGWTVVASRENGRAVLWFFTPQGHFAYPAVVKRTVVDRKGIGFIDVAALCEAPQNACNRLLQEFRQSNVPVGRRFLPREITLNVAIAFNEHERVRITRLVTEDGKAAEIRMDNRFKVVLMPTVDERRGVVLWAALYDFENGDYRLLSAPKLAMPGDGTADVRVSSGSGTVRFSVTPVIAAR